jgi:nucleotide-binding universal stress UspA family protein
MIKDVMVTLDGSAADEIRLAAVSTIAGQFDSDVIALFLNTVPSVVAVQADSPGPMLLEKAREYGDGVEGKIAKRLGRLNRRAEIRRVDVLADDIAAVAARAARTADAFVALRPNGNPEDPERLVEGVLFGSGRHLVLIPDGMVVTSPFDRILVAWNGSRKAARALSEAMPYVRMGKATTVVVVDEQPPDGLMELTGADAVKHLRHHGTDARLHRVREREQDVVSTLISEAERLDADLIVMGGYGHSRLRELMFGGVTRDMLNQAPVPLLIAH